MEVDFHSPELHQLSRDLELFARRGVPYAARNTLNRAAFEGRRAWGEKADSEMTLRNRWTKASMQVDRAKGRNVRGMEAILGSVAEYMAAQEGGDTKRAGAGAGSVPIPQQRARTGRSMQKLVRRPNRLARIQLRDSPSAPTPKQRNAIAIAMAQKAGAKFVYLETGDRKGIFRLKGGRSTGTTQGRNRLRLELMWDLSQNSVRIPATHTLERTLEHMEGRMPDIARRALLEQLRRNRVLKSANNFY